MIGFINWKPNYGFVENTEKTGAENRTLPLEDD
jgi:hypothetical protein